MATINGTSGNDTLEGKAGADRIFGKEGDDTISGGAGHDTLYGGSGNDTFYGDDDTYDDFYGGDGDDVVYAGNSDNNWAYGGFGNDTYYGGTGSEMVYGGAGDDSIDGSEGADTLYGDEGADAINGGAGNDTVFGGAGDDRLAVSSGDNTLYGGSGNDGLEGGYGTDDTDTFYGGDGDDRIATNGARAEGYGGAGNDLIQGDSGEEKFYGGIGDDEIYGGSADDVLFAGAGNDMVFGGANDDLIRGEEGDDTLSGDTGNDTFQFAGGSGADLISGGDGDDLLHFFTSQDMTITFDELGRGSYSEAIGGSTGRFKSIEQVVTMSGNDTIDASASTTGQSFYSGAGDDTVSGGSGDDDIRSDTGNDTLLGGQGNDDLDGGAGDDTLYGGDGDDVLVGGAGSNQLVGGAGGDTFDGSAGSYDIVSYQSSDAGVIVDLSDEFAESGGDAEGDRLFDVEQVDGSEFDDALTADDSGQELQGRGGADNLTGGAGNDRLRGGAGDDTLRGGAGDDRLSGGTGNDTFELSDSGGRDVIADFDTADTDIDGKYNDQIDVSDLRTSSGDPVTGFDIIVTDDGSGNALLTFPEGETLVLQGVSPTQMDSAGEMYKAGIPCFTSEMPIMTPKGPVRAGCLRAGDLVVTRDGGSQPILWAGARKIDGATLRAADHMRPVRIRVGATNADLLVSPQHGLLARVPGVEEDVLVRARHLARLRGARAVVVEDVRSVSYVHLLLPRHALLWSQGVYSESFYPGAWGLRGLAGHDLLRIRALFPALASEGVLDGYGPMVRRFARFHELPNTDDQVELLGVSDVREMILA